MLAQRGSGGGGARGGARGSARGGSSGARGGANIRPVIYLATDSLPVVKESRAYAAHFDIVHLPQQEVGRHDPKMGQALLWDKRVWQRHFWGQTDWTQHMAWTATVEMLLLAHADLFIGAHGDDGVGTAAGAAYLAFGPISGTLILDEPEYKLSGEAAGDEAGFSVAPAGDVDNDGTRDDLDNCPFIVNPGQDDNDGDNVGDLCDSDLDGDGDLDLLIGGVSGGVLYFENTRSRSPR